MATAIMDWSSSDTKKPMASANIARQASRSGGTAEIDENVGTVMTGDSSRPSHPTIRGGAVLAGLC